MTKQKNSPFSQNSTVLFYRRGLYLKGNVGPLNLYRPLCEIHHWSVIGERRQTIFPRRHFTFSFLCCKSMSEKLPYAVSRPSGLRWKKHRYEVMGTFTSFLNIRTLVMRIFHTFVKISRAWYSAKTTSASHCMKSRNSKSDFESVSFLLLHYCA